MIKYPKLRDPGQAGDHGDLAQQTVDTDRGHGREATAEERHAAVAQQLPPPAALDALFARRTGTAALPAPRADMGREIATPTVTVQARYQQ